MRPSFSLSSTSPWTKRRPRLTWVSEGKDFRRLRVMLKAGEVFEIAELAHDTPPFVLDAACRRGGFLTTSRGRCNTNGDWRRPESNAGFRGYGFGVRACSALRNDEGDQSDYPTGKSVTVLCRPLSIPFCKNISVLPKPNQSCVPQRPVPPKGRIAGRECFLPSLRTTGWAAAKHACPGSAPSRPRLPHRETRRTSAAG